MNRRQFVTLASLAAAGSLSSRSALAADTPPLQTVATSDDALGHAYAAALATLRANVQRLSAWPQPLLVEGSTYHGVWMECGPQEAAVYSAIDPAARDVARANHLAFFALQRPDGQLPYSIKIHGPAWGQIQMVVPIAATAWELARRFGDEQLLDKAYAACSRWDAWLLRYRNTRGTGLIEGFCTYDTGMDNSPRWKGMPNTCPDGDARRCPSAPGLPRLCPDLSATTYGARLALAAMARALGRNSEADRWAASAQHIRALILDRLYDPQSAAFYDLDSNNRFVRVDSVVNLRVCGEHVPPPDSTIFQAVWTRQIHNPRAFWAPWPFPSSALDDPTFVRPIPRNSWGGAAQALTALRAPRWIEHYGKPAELAHVMAQWVEAIRRNGGFHQQMDPLTGEFTPDPGGYSPAALVFCDSLWRLSGIRQNGDATEWNIRPPAPGRSTFTAEVHGHPAELRYYAVETGSGTSSEAELILSGRCIARIRGTVRLLTSPAGELFHAIGIQGGQASVTLRLPGQPGRTFRIAANQSLSWTGRAVAS